MKKEDSSKKIDQVWNSIGRDSIEYLDRHFEDIASQLIHFLVISLLEHDEIEIETFSKKNQKGSIISYDIYHDEKQLNIKVNTDFIFEVELVLYDWDDNEKIYSHKLTIEQVKIIPEGLKNLMIEVSVNKKEMSIKAGTLRE